MYTYSVSSDSRRWWWPAAAAGAVASAVVGTALVTHGPAATPDPARGDSAPLGAVTPVDPSQWTCPRSSAPRSVRVPWVSPVGTGCYIDGNCVLDPQYLPRTPDAVEGWYRSCRERHQRALKGANDGPCVFDPQYLPRTPDAVEGWYRSCRARHQPASVGHRDLPAH